MSLVYLTSGIVAKADDAKTLLIINSYNENEPWANEMMQPVIMHLAEDENRTCEIFSLNNALIADSLDFDRTTHAMIEMMSDHNPTAVLMLGDLAFNMRDSICSAWGKDIPILLVTNNKEYAENKEYFKPAYSSLDLNTHHTLQSKRKDYNFTAIIIPEYYRETMNLMANMIPSMDKVVFLADSTYSNRKVANGLQNYINDEYPEVKFTWLKANSKNQDALYQLLIKPEPNTGILLSTWLTEKQGTHGFAIPSTSDLKLINASCNPIFSLRKSYMPIGAIGGVYADLELAQERELNLVDMMLAGGSLRDIPFFISEESYPCINYRLLSKYGLSEKNCPEGTVFYSKPLTIWEKYLWQTIAILALVTLVICAIMFRYWKQRKKIASLNRNQEFVGNMPIPYSTASIKYDHNGKVLTIEYTVKNHAFEELLNHNEVEDSPYRLFPADFIVPKVETLLKEKRMVSFPYHFKHTDTYYVFMLCFVNSRLNIRDKYVNQIDMFAIDVTNLRKMETRLERTTRKLNIAMLVTAIRPWQMDIATDTITYDIYSGSKDFIHEMSIERTGQTMPYKEFLASIHPEDRDMVAKKCDAVRFGEASDINIRFRRVINNNIKNIEWVELTGTVTERNKDGKPETVIGSNQIITDAIKQQQRMTAALERASESDRLKSVFLANMSHEIRTPLNAIVGFSNVIAHTEDADERLEFCDIINKNNEQLLSLINDVLDLAKIESNTIEINYEECDVNQMLEQIYRSNAIKVPPTVAFSIVKGSADCKAQLDPLRVTQILNNLLSNACKFTASGNISMGYEITESGMLYFYVRDTGRGINKVDHERVFERFSKLDSFVPGTGLGLPICKTLVEKMGGEIGVISDGEGYGSTFWFTVPYVPATGYSELFGDEGFFKKNFCCYNESKDTLKILIAEDNEGNYRLLAHLLKDHFELIRASNGIEAIEMFNKEKPDVILMDISMPEMDGYEAFFEIRRESDVPIIAVTAYVYASEKSKLIEDGFDGFVSKPITQKAIIDAIGKALTK